MERFDVCFVCHLEPTKRRGECVGRKTTILLKSEQRDVWLLLCQLLGNCWMRRRFPWCWLWSIFDSTGFFTELMCQLFDTKHFVEDRYEITWKQLREGSMTPCCWLGSIFVSTGSCFCPEFRVHHPVLLCLHYNLYELLWIKNLLKLTGWSGL